mgnify:CR=1 FL=1
MNKKEIINYLIFGVLTPAEALAGFSSTVVIMMVGLFVVGGAIFQTGLAKAASQRIMALAGGNDTFMFLLVMFATAIIGAFVSNTGTIALMMPVVVSVATQKGMHPGRMLMPLAFASSMGGMLTLIGTPPNLVIQEALTQAATYLLFVYSRGTYYRGDWRAVDVTPVAHVLGKTQTKRWRCSQ